MPKKKTKPLPEQTDQAAIESEIKKTNSKEYREYLQEHKRKLQRALREASGENLSRPWGDYE